MTSTTVLPPYLLCESEANDLVNEVRFFEFLGLPCHPHLPFVMRRDYYEKGEKSCISRHIDFLALYAVRSGSGVHLVDNHSYGLVRGDVYLMAPGARHRFVKFTQLELDVFFFESSLFSADELSALRQNPGIWRLFAGGTDMEHRIHLSPDEWRGIEGQIEMMRKGWGDASTSGGLLLKHDFFRLLITLARQVEKSNLVSTAVAEERRLDSGLAEALRYCEEHFDKPLSVSRLAARAFLSRGHFTELFSREIGMSPAAYVRHIRLEKARALLRDTNLPVGQIALECGFRNAAQFSRAFNNFYSMPPLRYRKRELLES